MNLDPTITAAAPSALGAQGWRLSSVVSVAVISAAMSVCSACGAAAYDEPAPAAQQGESEAESAAAEVPTGAVSIEASFGGAARAPLVAWLSPLVTVSGWGCPSSCASALAGCAEECQPQWLATDVVREWPGVASVRLEHVPPGRYWLFAHLSSKLPDDLLPRPGDPVSRGAPGVVEVSAGEMAIIALTLDATFTTRVTEQEPACAARVEPTVPRQELNVGQHDAQTPPRLPVHCSADAAR